MRSPAAGEKQDSALRDLRIDTTSRRIALPGEEHAMFHPQGILPSAQPAASSRLLK